MPLLADAGAKVTVVAPELGDELTTALGRGAFAHVARAFAPGDIEGAWLAVAATNDREVNAAVASASPRTEVRT